MRTIIACKDDQRVLLHSILFYCLHDLSYKFVESRYHGGESSMRIGIEMVCFPVGAFHFNSLLIKFLHVIIIYLIMRHDYISMRQGVGQICKEGLVMF